jgi:carbon storage regulator CsrA
MRRKPDRRIALPGERSFAAERSSSMLVLSRKRGQSITIGDQIVITVVRLSRGNVQIGIDAPGHVSILRQEIVERLIDSGAIEDHGVRAGRRERVAAR